MPDLMPGKRDIADMNQNIAEPHAVIIAPVSMSDLIITPQWFRDGSRLYCQSERRRHVETELGGDDAQG
ncbi:MAG: hypothetical protein ACLQF4_11465, partial [Xanthobacteraceae bacterium]